MLRTGRLWFRVWYRSTEFYKGSRFWMSLKRILKMSPKRWTGFWLNMEGSEGTDDAYKTSQVILWQQWAWGMKGLITITSPMRWISLLFVKSEIWLATRISNGRSSDQEHTSMSGGMSWSIATHPPVMRRTASILRQWWHTKAGAKGENEGLTKSTDTVISVWSTLVKVNIHSNMEHLWQ